MKSLPIAILASASFVAACAPSAPPVDPDLAAGPVEAYSEPSDGGETEVFDD